MASKTYRTKSGREFDVTYDEKDKFDPYYVTRAERYRMRNIPFFVIPPCESKAFDPSKVKSKIDTRNTNYHPSRTRSQSDSSCVSALSRPRAQRASTQSPLASNAASRSSSLGNKDLLRYVQPGRHSLSPVRKSGKDLFGAQTRQGRRVRSPLQKSARVTGDGVNGEGSDAVFDGHFDGKDGGDSGEILAHEDSAVESSVETTAGRESAAGGRHSNQPVGPIEGEIARGKSAGWSSVDTLEEKAHASFDATLPSTGTGVAGAISVKGSIVDQPSDNALAGVERTSATRNMQVSRHASAGPSKQVEKDSNPQVTGNRASNLKFAAGDVMPNDRTTGRDSPSGITAQKASVSKSATRSATQFAHVGFKRSPRGPSGPVGVAAREAWSSDTEKSGKKRVGVGKVADYSHVKSRISTRRSVKTEEVNGKEEELKKFVSTATSSVMGIPPEDSASKLSGKSKSSPQEPVQRGNKPLERQRVLEKKAITGGLKNQAEGDKAEKGTPEKHPEAEKVAGKGALHKEKRIPSYGVGTNRRYANVRSKIDQSDPNPAHKLQHSVEDLTIDSRQGRQINPRFSSSRFASQKPAFSRGRTVDFNDRFPHHCSLVDYRYKRSASVDSPLGPIQSRPASTFPVRKERVPKLAHMSRVAEAPKETDFFEEAEEDEVLSGAKVSSELDQRERTSAAFAALAEEEEEQESAPEAGSSDMGIYGMEVTNSGTETTVVLKHLLALARKQSPETNSDMAIIEEDELEEEEEYYESHDSVLASPASVGSTFQLPHPIPRLVVTSEEGELVETVVEKARSSLSVSAEDQEELKHAVLSTRL